MKEFDYLPLIAAIPVILTGFLIFLRDCLLHNLFLLVVISRGLG